MIQQLIDAIISASTFSTFLSLTFILLHKKLIKSIGSIWSYRLWFIIFIPWLVVCFSFNFLGAFLFLILNKWLLLSLINRNLIFKIYSLFVNDSFNSFRLFFIIWIIGLFICLFYFVFQHLKFVYTIKNNSQKLSIHEKTIIKKHLANNQYRHIERIYLVNTPISPMLCNIINPIIYLPLHFFRNYTAEEQRFILQHEFFHFKRHDLTVNAVIIFFICINWFNPIIFLGARYFRHLQELSCDATVCQKLTNTEKKSYGYALIKTVSSKTATSKFKCEWSNKNALKERCQMLAFSYSTFFKIVFGLCFFIATIFITLIVASLQNRNNLFFYASLLPSQSHYILKIINNSDRDPLNYNVETSDKKSFTGLVHRGDMQGAFIINNEDTSELTIINSRQKIIWKSLVKYSGKNSFTMQIITLNSGYHVATHFLKKIDAVLFDITKND